MAETGDGDDREWRYSLEDLEDRGDGDDRDDGGADGDEYGGGEGIAGTLAPSESIEPGEIDPEHALFVLLGVVLAFGFILGLVLGTP